MRVFAVGRSAPAAFASSWRLGTDPVAERITAGGTHVVRCATAAELPEQLRRISAGEGITRLDVLDHGAEGLQTLGDGLLFASDASPESALIGRELAEQIEPYLAETAQVRLLGCNTGEGKAGRLLLLKLARVLGRHRIVFGTIDRVVDQSFDRDGYAEVMEHQRLFSSVAALDMEAPGAMRRFENMRVVKAAII